MSVLDKLTREDLIFEECADGKWHTISELSKNTGYPEASVSCGLRTLRREENGGFTVEKEYDSVNKVYLYRVTR